MLSVTFSDQGFDHEIRSVQICEDNSITALSAAIDSAFTLWVFDTGSASTVCNNKDLFQSLSPLSTPLWLRGFDNNRTQVFAHGPINLSFRSSDGKPIYGTVDALHVPTLDWNSVPSHILEVLPSLHLLSTVNNMLLVDDEKESPFATFDKQSRTWFLQNGAYPDKSLETRRRETSEANLDFWHMLCNHAALSCVQQLQKFTQTPHQPSGRIQKPVDCVSCAPYDVPAYWRCSYCRSCYAEIIPATCGSLWTCRFSRRKWCCQINPSKQVAKQGSKTFEQIDSPVHILCDSTSLLASLR